jgi:hypothetical protein
VTFLTNEILYPTHRTSNGTSYIGMKFLFVFIGWDATKHAVKQSFSSDKLKNEEYFYLETLKYLQLIEEKDKVCRLRPNP